MTTQINVPIATQQFLALAAFLDGHGSSQDPVDVVGLAIDYWMDNADWKPEFFETGVRGRGYRWKELFLPHGTEARFRYKAQYHYARVDGDEFQVGSQPTSPAHFANSVANSSRNAWRDIEVKRPGDREWRLAQSLRKGG
ncbi:hypothetical protein [Brevundimonas sp.]|jgi:hypothetical protein|uniref:hypothetical protein n=1 Tax=Brevundimonas sp. TaxID=1871086 RepID=UPI002E0D3C08|nr:hypothetical protein [Brevundimonas sp.]